LFCPKQWESYKRYKCPIKQQNNARQKMNRWDARMRIKRKHPCIFEGIHCFLWVTLMAAIPRSSNWTSQMCISAPSALVSVVSSRRLIAKLRYPADSAESRSGSKRFLMRASRTSGSFLMQARHATTPATELK
jgi:hypothetical protein